MGNNSVYYTLACYGPTNQDRAELMNIPRFEGVHWSAGKRFNTSIPTPIIIELDPDAPGILLPMFYKSILLMSDEMTTVLRDAGVDNMDLYDVILRDTVKGTDLTNYKAVNIVGTLACADLKNSEYSDPSGSGMIDMDFDSLAIDESKTSGMLMFRLAECITAIIIHEKVKEALEKYGIEHLDIQEPKEFIG